MDNSDLIFDTLKAMKRADEAEPTWRENYTVPYIKAIEDKLSRTNRNE